MSNVESDPPTNACVCLHEQGNARVTNRMSTLLRAIKLNDKTHSKKLKKDLKEAKRNAADEAKKNKKDLKVAKRNAADKTKRTLKALKVAAAEATKVLKKEFNEKHAMAFLDSKRMIKPEVDLAVPYCVKATSPIYEIDMPCSVKVDEEPVSMYIDEAWINATAAEITSGSAQEYMDFNAYIQKEYGQLFKTGYAGNYRFGIIGNVVKKLFYINRAFMKLSVTQCQDSRCVVTGLNIIEPDRFADEVNGDVSSIMRRGRGFTVNDTVAFNNVLRKLQSTHPTFPRKTAAIMRGTKGITDVLYLVGLGPPSAAHAHNAARYRGPRSTDPDKKKKPTPGVDDATVSSERDGLYFRRYDYTDDRVYKGCRRGRHFKGPSHSMAAMSSADTYVGTFHTKTEKRSLLELYELELCESD